jgi:hypothetical protein
LSLGCKQGDGGGSQLKRLGMFAWGGVHNGEECITGITGVQKMYLQAIIHWGRHQLAVRGRRRYANSSSPPNNAPHSTSPSASPLASSHVILQPPCPHRTYNDTKRWPTSLIGGERPTLLAVAAREANCLCLFSRIMAATQAPIWKDRELDHEQDDVAPNSRTTFLEIDYILSSLALLCILFTFPKLIDQILPLGEVLNSNDVGVITWY